MCEPMSDHKRLAGEKAIEFVEDGIVMDSSSWVISATNPHR